MKNQETGQCSCKIGRVGKKYQIDDLDDELVRRRNNDGASLRTLADYINKRILSAAINDADTGYDIDDMQWGINDEDIVTTIYNILSNDDIPVEQVVRVKSRLEKSGIDVDTLTNDWVTHPTVRDHFRKCLDINTSRQEAITIDDAIDTIEWARARCSGVIDTTFKRLTKANLVKISNHKVSITIRITCTECGEIYRPTSLIEQRSCSCNHDDDEKDTVQ